MPATSEIHWQDGSVIVGFPRVVPAGWELERHSPDSHPHKSWREHDGKFDKFAYATSGGSVVVEYAGEARWYWSVRVLGYSGWTPSGYEDGPARDAMREALSAARPFFANL